MNIYYSDPHPRILFEEVPDDVFDRLEPLAASSRRIQSDEGVHESEWDLLVTFAENAGRRSKSLHVLSFGADALDDYRSGTSSFSISRSHETSAQEVRIPEDLNPRIARLLESTVIPSISPRSRKRTWRRGGVWDEGFGKSNRTGDLGADCSPLLCLGPEGFVYALSRTRPSSNTFCLALPSETKSHESWLALVLELLRKVDPQRFPESMDWESSENWMTPDMAKAADELSSVERERQEALRIFELREQTAQEALTMAQAAAHERPWRLVTAKDDVLEQEVAATLREFGLEVQEMDETHVAKNGARLEDLRVSDPNDPDWLCLVEVKGYANGVRENDIPQVVGRPTAHLAMNEKREPSTVWFVFNAWISRPPGDRPPALGNPDLALAPLEQYDGVAIDTQDLFRAWRDVRQGTSRLDEVRDSLKSARGLWSWPDDNDLDRTR